MPIAYLKYLILIFKNMLQYQRVYRNYMTMALHSMRRQYPITAVMKNNGELFTFNDDTAVLVPRYRKGVDMDIRGDSVTLLFRPSPKDVEATEIKLHGAVSNGDAIEIFLDGTYSNLPVEGKVVVDIGCNIGDSSIYFALRGASKVIGIDPFPKNIKIARINVNSNRLSNRVELRLEGIGAERGTICLGNNEGTLYASIPSSRNVHDSGMNNVPIVTLQDILMSCNSADAILKVDCEGCEYDCILPTEGDVLNRFSHIQIEYHLGYIDLKRKLEQCGFSVTCSLPRAGRIMAYGKYKGRRPYLGMLYAQRIKNKLAA